MGDNTITMRALALQYKQIIFDFEEYATLHNMNHGNKRKFAAGYFQSVLLCVNRDTRISVEKRMALHDILADQTAYYKNQAEV